MDASSDKPGAAGTSMESPDKQVFVPRISVSLSASMVAKKAKKKSKKPKRITYYCPYDLNERDPDEITPLHVAIHARKLECVKLLLEAGASVHKKNDECSDTHRDKYWSDSGTRLLCLRMYSGSCIIRCRSKR
jgi:hypothetical protein